MSKPFPIYTETPYDINEVETLFRDAGIVIPKKGVIETNKWYLMRIKDIYNKEMVKLGKTLYTYSDISDSHSMYDRDYQLWQTLEEKKQYLEELEVKKAKKAAQRARNNQAYKNAQATKAAQAAQAAQTAKDAKVAACRALIAEVDTPPANVGGYRRRRMTKKRRNRKTKRSRK